MGNQIDFWSDKWIPSNSIPDFRLAMQKPQGSGVEKVSDVLKSRGGEWNVGLLRTLIPRDEWRVVFEIPISSNPKKDGYTNLAFHEFWVV